MARTPAAFACRAVSSASSLRGTLSGSLCTWMSTKPWIWANDKPAENVRSRRDRMRLDSFNGHHLGVRNALAQGFERLIFGIAEERLHGGQIGELEQRDAAGRPVAFEHLSRAPARQVFTSMLADHRGHSGLISVVGGQVFDG